MTKHEKKEARILELKTKHFAVIILALILILGLYLRIYHIDYPVIGYHNWKETHYLTEARNFAREGFFKYGFFIPYYDYPKLYGHPSGVHADTFPTISIIVALAFMIFGRELWVARLVGILFNLGSVVVMYFLVRELYEREDMALLAGFITSVLPLFVFFSRNVQLINPALFFMLTSAYFYVKWRKNFSGRYLILTSLFLMLGTVTKYSFGVIAIPMLLTFPFKKFREWKKCRKEFIIAFLILLLFPSWHLYANYLIPAEYREVKQAGLHQIQIEKVFELNLRLIWSFIIDNYTEVGFYIAILGLFFVAYDFYKKRNFSNLFILGYAFSIIPFTILMSSKLSGHNYHQYPIAPLVVILIAYFIIKIADFFGRIRIEGMRIRYSGLLPIVAFILLFIPINTDFYKSPTYDSIARQFDTQFPGLDIAGEYIKEHSSPNERIIFPSHQSYGVLWHADRKGYGIGIPKPEHFEYSKNKSLNVTWIFIYQWGLRLLQHEEEWNYIKERFSLKQIAFKPTESGSVPIYLLMREGGSFDESKLNDMLRNRKINKRIYETTMGKYVVVYVNFD